MGNGKVDHKLYYVQCVVVGGLASEYIYLHNGWHPLLTIAFLTIWALNLIGAIDKAYRLYSG